MIATVNRGGLSMSLKLFSHNQSAFESAVEMLHDCGKAAVVHPTGTGKSYIGFKLCEQFPDKTVCWLSPSEYIFKTQLENLKDDSEGWQPKNFTFYTYAKLMLMTDAELAEINPDYIVLDEFHRCGAEMWGDGVERLLSMYPDAPILGLSATAIRYLDNQRNMADELFDGNIASEMTLGEAIVRGILNPPKYVLSVFAYQEDYNRLKRRVKSAKTKVVKDQAEKYLEALRRALEMADGLDKIFDKHMENRTGKYIVFCSNIEHLREMQSKAKEWFGKIDSDLHVYTAYSDDPTTSKEFADFKADSSDHLKLLYAIDMLNEGIHVDDIDGVILFRPTVSPIIYKQQIGRALAAGKNNIPVIFDIVNNIENLYSIGTIRQEMQVAISYYRSLGEDGCIVNDRFEVIDEVKSAKELFDQLNDTLSASWETLYFCAKRYYESNGNLNVPFNYKTPEGYSLGTWIFTQRQVYGNKRNGTLTPEQIEKLEAIGMVWDNKTDMAWNARFQAAKLYYKEHGDLLVPASYVTDDGMKLGVWISNLRAYRKSGAHKNALTPERIKKLDDIGMVWDGLDYMWYRNFSAAAQYYHKHGDLNVPSGYVDENGIKLYQWLISMRMAYRRVRDGDAHESSFPKDKISLLESIGMDWRTWPEVQWDKAYDAAKLYSKAHGNLEVPLRYKTESGFRLGIWINEQRKKHLQGKLSREQISRLNRLDMVWDKSRNPYSWDNTYHLAKQYFEKHGDLVVPVDYMISGVRLNTWLSSQRVMYHKGQLSGERIVKLENIGMFWGTRAEREWNEQFDDAKLYFQEHGNLSVPKEYISAHGKKTKYWLDKQYSSYKKGKLSLKQIELLESITAIKK